MEYKHEFAGISSNGDKKFEDEFEIIYNNGDDELVAVTKNEYQCYLGSKTINYKIGIQVEDGSDFGSEGNMYVNLYLIPCFRNIHKEKREALIKEYAQTYIDPKDYGKKDDKYYFQDVIWEGHVVYLYNTVIEYVDDEDYKSKQRQLLDDCANAYQAITGLIEFYLDRYVNRIGYTGWDYLRIFCNGVKDSTILREVIRRHKAA